MMSKSLIKHCIAAMALAWLGAGAVGAAEITIACGSVGSDVEICRKLMEEWSARTGNKVRIFVTPNSSTTSWRCTASSSAPNQAKSTC
jgi:trehalose/maltose transport system substrate-binding protein